MVPGVNELLVQPDLVHTVENEFSGGTTPGSIPNAGGRNIPQDGAGVDTSLGRLLRVLHHCLVDGLGIGSKLELADESLPVSVSIVRRQHTCSFAGPQTRPCLLHPLG